MNGLALLGALLAAYGIFCIYVAFAKPPKIWTISKIQGFVKALTTTGTVIFFTVFGLAALGVGIWLIVK